MYRDAFVAPAPSGRHVNDETPRSVALVVFAAILALCAGAGFVNANATRSWFPSKWDPRVAPIAAEVSKLRGLDFLHPVPIEYLTPAAFEKALGSGGAMTAAERADVQREESVFRALGLIGGKADLLAGIDTSQSSGTLAYYDPDHQDIIVRGTTLDAEHRVTVAHEMTHVLQDQHFDLRKLQKQAADSSSGDSDALRALVEGDAVRIQDDYLAQLSSAEQAEYHREDDAEGARIGKETASVPDIVNLLDSAPYEYGPATVRVLLDSGGNEAVNDALTGATPSSSVFVETGDITPPVAVDPPLIPPGGTAVGDPETFGPFETYLTLATRIDPQRALEAADTVAGGEAVTYRTATSTCYRVALSPTFEHSRPYLQRTVTAWARGRTRTTLDAAGDLVGFTACDPGRTAPDPSEARFHNTVDLLSVRTGLTVGAAKDHISGDLARCVARVFVQQPGATALLLAIGDGTPTAKQNAELRPMATASGEACRADTSAGLP